MKPDSGRSGSHSYDQNWEIKKVVRINQDTQIVFFIYFVWMRLKCYLSIPQGFIAHVFVDWEFFLDEKGDISSKGCVSVGIWPN